MCFVGDVVALFSLAKEVARPGQESEKVIRVVVDPGESAGAQASSVQLDERFPGYVHELRVAVNHGAHLGILRQSEQLIDAVVDLYASFALDSYRAVGGQGYRRLVQDGNFCCHSLPPGSTVTRKPHC